MKLLLSLLLFFSVVNAAGVAMDEKLGTMIPLNLKFMDDKGKTQTLKQLMHGKPTLLTLNYYKCAGICTTELIKLAETLEKVDLKEGKDYQVLTVSFSEDEPASLAAHKRRTIFSSMTRDFDHNAWNFVIGQNGSSKKLADIVGFHFEKSDLPSAIMQYTHATGVIALSADGKITRYLQGVTQLPIDIKMAVLDAAKGKVTKSIPKQLQSCSDFHPKEKLVLPTEQIVGAIISLIAIAIFIRLLLSSRKNRVKLTKEEYYRQQEEEDSQKKDKEN